MANNPSVEDLKVLLRREVAIFCRRDERKWKEGISNTIDEIRANNWPAVFFGGTLRSLLLSRLAPSASWRPRDVDIVVRGVGLGDLEQQFEPFISRETRFGGLQLKRIKWQFDLWPLERTFALSNDGLNQPDFQHLPSSTFLNLEAVAVDIWPQPGRPRTVYSGDDQFFTGVISRTIEINREENPFPELSVVRALVLAGDLQWRTGNLSWRVGPKLLRYIAQHGNDLSEADLNEIQIKHYGKIEWHGTVLRRVFDYIYRRLDPLPKEPVELPLQRQLGLWGEAASERDWARIRVSTVTPHSTSKKPGGPQNLRKKKRIPAREWAKADTAKGDEN